MEAGNSPGVHVPKIARAALLLCLYLLMSVLAMGVNPFKGKTITPFDLLISQRAWSAVEPGANLRQGERSDILDSRLPKWINAKEQIRAGHLPVWNPDRGGGEEALFNLGYSIFTPAWAIFAITPSEPVGFYLANLFNLMIAGLGMHLFLRKKVGFLAAVVGAISFELCGFHAAWFYWPHVLTSIWAPWLLLSVESVIVRPSLKSCLVLSMASAMVILGGFPFVGMLVFGAGALYALTLLFPLWRKGGGVAPAVSWYVLGTLFSFALCALPLIGFYYWLGSYDISYRHGGSILHPKDWQLIFAPWAYDVMRVEKTLYVGTAMAILAIAAPFYLLARRKISPLLVFSVLLLLISSSLVFGLFPMWLAERLPGLSNNIWTRAICIFDLALILLGVQLLGGLSELAWAERRWWLAALAVAVSIVQISDVGTFFRRYNGPVRTAFYYPKMPSIEYMRSHVGDFDYVIGDRSFLISGTLDAYGMREWFAHKFRSKALKDALMEMADNAFSSPTSSRLASKDIKVDSNAMSVFNVRYVAVDSNADPYAIRPEASRSHDRSPLPAMPAHRYRQELRLKSEQQVTGVSVQLATYRKSNFKGVLLLSLLGQDGGELFSIRKDAGSVTDDSIQNFELKTPYILRPGTYSITLSFKPDNDPRPITAWSYASQGDDGKLYVNGNPSDQVIDYSIHVIAPGGKFRKVFTEAGISVYENTNNPDGPYFLRGLNEIPDSRSGSDVSVLDYMPEKFDLEYDGVSAGYVVVPMNMRPDWRVSVNGQEVKTSLMRGLMPAVSVSGPSHISFEYRSRVYRWIFTWVLGLGALLALMGGLQWHFRRRES